VRACVCVPLRLMPSNTSSFRVIISLYLLRNWLYLRPVTAEQYTNLNAAGAILRLGKEFPTIS
jgi:hypothetical protein